MMQITRKSSPLRGLTVLLALMLGAGLVLSGCGDDDSTTTTPAPAPAPPAPAPTPTLDAPGGLTVASSGTDYIEFSWEAVEGASGYEIQLSTTEGDFSSVSTASVTGTMHRFSVEPGTTAYARVRAVSDEANDSDWTEAVTGMSNAAPLVLATPTVRVKATGLDFLEWEWDAVANAQGYQLQVADSADGLEMAEMETVTATSHRVTVEPETTMYIRVRAGVLLPTPTAGDWSEAVGATSDMAPSPLLVSMSPPDADGDRACLGQPFCPDSGKDAKTAMATVNTKMMVTSSHSARITPMFMEGARPVVVAAGSDTPFTFVDWSATQMSVARDGAVFKFEKVTVGAGQETTPTGDVAYITCGPFRCSDAAMEEPAAPAITLADSAACTAFEASLDLVKGMADNDDAQGRSNGVDVGFTYTASHGATVTHEFSDVSFGGGGAYRVRGATLSATSTPTALVMAASGSGNTARNNFGGAMNRDADAATQSQPGPIRSGANDCFPDALTDDLNASYASTNISLNDLGANTPGKHSLTGTAVFSKPENCVRLITDGVYETVPSGKQTVRWRDYVSGYRVHINPAASVVWGGSSVSWSSLDDDPFDGLTCPSQTFEVADMLDACQDFKDEVDAYWGAGIGPRGQFRVEYVGGGTGVTARLTNIVIRNKADATSDGDAEDVYRPRGARHAHLWLQDTRDDPSLTIGIDGTQEDHDLYSANPSWNARHGSGTEDQAFGASGNWLPLMSVYMFDGDDDPKYGDFGKTDFQTSGTGFGTADNTTTIDDAASRACTASDGGAGCDAEMTFDLSATFTRIKDTDTCTHTIEQSITCTWDADGDRQRGGPGNFDIDNTSPHQSHFIKCNPA